MERNQNVAVAVISFFLFLCQVGCQEQKTGEEHFYSGVEKANSGDYQGAIEDYNKAIELNPKYAEAFYNRGFAKGELGYSKAYEAIRKYCHQYIINYKLLDISQS